MPSFQSPPPSPGDGWSSPGLELNSGGTTPVTAYPTFDRSGRRQSPRARPKTQTYMAHNQGFFARNMRRISSGLPTFNPSAGSHHVEKDKPVFRPRSAWQRLPLAGRIRRCVGRSKLRLVLILLPVLFMAVLVTTPLRAFWKRTSWLGDGERFVIILAANVGGGVTELKGAREWAIEKDSMRNKRRYAAKWGYDLEVVDMRTKRRYAHEWRESWEKADAVRETLAKYPNAEWIWWLDLNTLIMEPSYSLQAHIFDDLSSHVYRDINEYNPLNIPHPLTDVYLDPVSLSPVGDGRAESINLVLTQDCDGFNLGSFFLRRGDWTDRLLDVWWDPVMYEQRHMEWEHKEQDALEQLYTTQPWVRQHVAFLPQRMVNSFPTGACADRQEEDKKRFHYSQEDRDFVVNMAGCQWGRDCWAEMYTFRELSYYLNRGLWGWFVEDVVAKVRYKLTGQKTEFGEGV